MITEQGKITFEEYLEYYKFVMRKKILFANSVFFALGGSIQKSVSVQV